MDEDHHPNPGDPHKCVRRAWSAVEGKAASLPPQSQMAAALWECDGNDIALDSLRMEPEIVCRSRGPRSAAPVVWRRSWGQGRGP